MIEFDILTKLHRSFTRAAIVIDRRSLVEISNSIKIILKLLVTPRPYSNIIFNSLGNTHQQLIETAKENFHDGEWHSVAFEMDNSESTEGNRYVAKFSTDGKTRLSTLSSKFKFKGYITIGYSFLRFHSVERFTKKRSEVKYYS